MSQTLIHCQGQKRLNLPRCHKCQKSHQLTILRMSPGYDYIREDGSTKYFKVWRLRKCENCGNVTRLSTDLENPWIYKPEVKTKDKVLNSFIAEMINKYVVKKNE